MTPARVAVCLITGLQSVAVAAVAAYYLVELSRGQGFDGAGIVSSIVLFAIVAVALAALALGWWRRASWPRTATVVWNLVLAPVAVALVQGGQTVLGVGLGLVVVAAVASALAVPGRPVAAADEGPAGREGDAIL
ncbi:hypothetical protein V3N99_04340 [Dermatophilaceae bacterium Soc4.6]